MLARKVGVKHLVVFVNKVDLVADTELLDLIELETRDLLTRYGFDGDKVPFVRGNAKGALDHPADPAFSKCIEELLDALDAHIPAPPRDVEKPFLLAVEGVYSIEGLGTVATGLIAQGRVATGDRVEIVGLGESVETVDSTD